MLSIASRLDQGDRLLGFDPPFLRRDLAIWWRGFGTPLTSTTILDSSGRGNHGQQPGTNPVPSYRVDPFGFAFKFPGAPFIRGLTAVGIPNGVSVSYWLKPSAVSGAGILINTGSNSPNILITGLGAIQWNGSSGTVQTANSLIVANLWVHLAVTQNAAGAAVIYVNGTPKASGPVSTSYTTGIWSVGSNSGFAYNGLMADFRLYTRALAGAEVSRLTKLPFMNQPLEQMMGINGPAIAAAAHRRLLMGVGT